MSNEVKEFQFDNARVELVADGMRIEFIYRCDIINYEDILHINLKEKMYKLIDKGNKIIEIILKDSVVYLYHKITIREIFTLSTIKLPELKEMIDCISSKSVIIEISMGNKYLYYGVIYIILFTIAIVFIGIFFLDFFDYRSTAIGGGLAILWMNISKYKPVLIDFRSATEAQISRYFSWR